ncbi:MAG: hypothetical protein OHK0022_28510 [Roseiflexaceae bacterium]
MLITLLQATLPETPPFSAFALCYLPLALVVFGLITAFSLTDWHARRPYLRFNPFLFARGEHEDRAPATGETPAGPLGPTGEGDTTVFQGRYTDVAPAKSTEVPPPATKAPGDKPDAGSESGAGKPRT